MEKKKTFKQFRDDVRKRKIRKRGKRNDENYPSQGNKASPESRTRLGGSTSVLLPEPRARTMAQGVEINHSPQRYPNDILGVASLTEKLLS